MKKIYLTLLSCFIAIVTMAQTPGFSYQAVILNPEVQSLPGADVEQGLLSESDIAIRFTIENSVGDEYQETHTTKTDAYGMVHLMVGQGVATIGNFLDVAWVGSEKYLKVEIDFTASGSSYEALDRQALTYLPQPLSLEGANRINELELAITTVATELTTIELTPGAQGIQGIAGNDGTDGKNGTDGVDGTDGIDGTDGATGATGIDGTDGGTGSTGLTGATGIQGIAGTDGHDGETGQTGAQGNQGYQGNQGNQGDTGAQGNQGATGAQGPTGDVGAQGTLPNGGAAGEMVYWSGTTWLAVTPTTNDSATFMFVSGVPTWVGGTPPPAVIGDYRDGGVVFWVDGNGGGLVCDINDLPTSFWGCYGSYISGGAGTMIGTGAQNTIDIEASCTTANTAADRCANLTLNGYSDWFLPSKDELNQMYINKATINATAALNSGFAFGTDTHFYWSSSEYSNWAAWAQNLFNATATPYDSDKVYEHSVRAVRAF